MIEIGPRLTVVLIFLGWFAFIGVLALAEVIK
jgi:hypothetical protein